MYKYRKQNSYIELLSRKIKETSLFCVHLITSKFKRIYQKYMIVPSNYKTRSIYQHLNNYLRLRDHNKIPP